MGRVYLFVCLYIRFVERNFVERAKEFVCFSRLGEHNDRRVVDDVGVVLEEKRQAGWVGNDPNSLEICKSSAVPRFEVR